MPEKQDELTPHERFARGLESLINRACVMALQDMQLAISMGRSIASKFNISPELAKTLNKFKEINERAEKTNREVNNEKEYFNDV